MLHNNVVENSTQQADLKRPIAKVSRRIDRVYTNFFKSLYIFFSLFSFGPSEEEYKELELAILKDIV
jgi:hypothetical protein